jgi:glycosyltransferase involved in cell wall biosynthesis
VSVLSAADPEAHGIERVVTWAPRATLEQLPARPWLEARASSALEGSAARRLLWQRYAFPRVARAEADLTWVLGGNAGDGLRGFVAMSQNMLAFEPAERARYGASPVGLRLALLARAQPRTFRRAAGALFLTRYARDVVARRVPELTGRVAVVPHGVDPRFRRAPRAQRPLSSYSAQAPFRLLYVSIVDVYKHPWNLAEAVVRLHARGAPVALDLVGPAYGPALARLRDVLSRIDPSGRCVTYRGPLPFDELPAAYHAADGFAFASSCENMPNIVLEAMAAGLPIASSRRGPMPEILGEDASFFDPEDVDQATAALGRLVEDHALRERLARAAHARSLPFTWGRCASETFAFLAEVGRHVAGGRAP